MELKTLFAQDLSGNALRLATCRLYHQGTDTLVSGLQDSTGAALGNPWTTDARGLVQFAAPNGLYDLRVTFGARDYSVRVQCLDLAEQIAAIQADASRAEVARDAATASAEGATDSKNASIESANAANLAKAAAEAAAESARLSSGVFPDTASGLAATTSGNYFSVLSPNSSEYIILYLNSTGAAVEQRRYPSSSRVDDVEAETKQIGVIVNTQQEFLKDEVFDESTGGLVEVDDDERKLMEVTASGREFFQHVTLTGGASANDLILGGQETSFLDSEEFDASGVFSAEVDEDGRIFEQRGIDGIKTYLKQVLANFGGQQVQMCEVDEFELSGVDFAVIDEDWRIIAGSTKSIIQSLLPISGGTMTGPLILASTAESAFEATPLSQVQSIAEQAATDAVTAVNSRALQRKGQIKCAMLGDSRTANAFLFGGQASQPRSYPYWAQLFSRGAIRFIGAWNFAVAGETSAQTLARVPSAVATGADAVCIMTEVNDAYGADTIGNIQAMISAIVAAGKIAIVIAELPRGANAAAWTAARLAQHWKVRQRILQMAQQDNVRVVDAMPLVLDPSSPIGEWRAGYSYDAVHATCEGGLHIGKSFADAVADLGVTQTPTLLTNMDVYSAADNPNGNHTTNGMLTGTGGTRAGSGSSSGSVADNWTLYTSFYFTTAASKVVIDGTEWQQIQFSGTPANSGQYVLFSQQQTPGNFSAGDTVEIVCEIEVDAGSVAMFGPEFYFAINETDEVSLQPETAVGWMDPVGATSPNASSAYAGLYHSQPYTFTATPSSARVGIRVRGQNGTLSSGTFRVSRVSLRKV
ncbi:SGNH/GDSL hydrolase family protein [Azotobacter beijerinckii]|uniref:SGNH/GDSL hydrolase family protein n=1 Tax=Azotobacter beijerinckii TaxID=170623 RepID=UPI0029553A2E|nr:SGNH/GDSL hydrolase family protein [Azotobacter beijerinckii]MDV7209882.1 SGNH/GDSL hydrolase family protein [Azotobacter beijerinckii]